MLGFISDFPFYYTIFCIILGLGYASFLYKRGTSIALNRLTLGLFIFRAIFTSVLAFLLLNPVIRSDISITARPIVIIAKDNSQSIEDEINNDLELLIDGLGDFEVFTCSFEILFSDFHLFSSDPTPETSDLRLTSHSRPSQTDASP